MNLGAARRRAAWTLGGLLACGPGLPASDETGAGASTSAGTSTTEAAPTSAGAATGGTEIAGETTVAAAVDTSAGSSSTGEQFLVPLDAGGVQTCNIFTQNCPPGEKCTPYADDGGTSWNNDKCVPVAPDPKQVGEPCTAPEGGVAGIDDCDVGLMCWDVDAENHGVCIELCSGSAEQGFCDTPCTTCAAFSGGTLALCLPTCNPVLQNCDPSDVCIGNPTGEGFLCVLDASGDEGQVHDPCEFANSCDPGLMCADPVAAVECDQNAQGCCEPFCDIFDPDADSKCPGVGQVCNPYFEEGMAPDCVENAGYCAVPM